MFPGCTLSQAEKALAMALGNLEEAVQLIVEEKVEIGPAGASVKVLYSELGGLQGAWQSSGTHRCPNCLLQAEALTAGTFCITSWGDHPEQKPLSFPWLSKYRLCPQPSQCPRRAVAGTPFPPGLAGSTSAGLTEPAVGSCMLRMLCCSPTCLVSSQELARPRRAPNHEELKQVILQK